jgi:hypothetical protein
MAEIPVLAQLTASDLFFSQSDDFRLVQRHWRARHSRRHPPGACVCDHGSDGEHSLLQQSVGAAAVVEGR